MLKLPAGQEAIAGSAFDIKLQGAYDENWPDSIVLNNYMTSPVIGEAWSTTKWYRKLWKLYLYEVPEEFSDSQIRMEVTGRATGTAGSSSYLTMTLRSGYLKIPYNLPFVDVCSELDRDDCSDTYLFLDETLSGSATSFDYQTNNLRGLLTSPRYIEGVLDWYQRRGTKISGTYTGASNIATDTLPKENAKLYILTESYEKYGSCSNLDFKDLKMEVSAKQYHKINNLKVMIGEDELNYYEGINEDGIVYLPEFAKTLNEYCGRDIGNDKECLVQIKFIADDGGSIVIDRELGGLEEIKVIETEEEIIIENDFQEPSIFTPLNILLSSLILISLIGLGLWGKFKK